MADGQWSRHLHAAATNGVVRQSLSGRGHCLAHKVRNLQSKVPEDLWPEFKARAVRRLPAGFAGASVKDSHSSSSCWITAAQAEPWAALLEAGQQAYKRGNSGSSAAPPRLIVGGALLLFPRQGRLRHQPPRTTCQLVAHLLPHLSSQIVARSWLT
jgi:hypothetical protein